jgi:hypothetical protein
MLISKRYKFLFLSNPKCASTSILLEWRKYSQLSIEATAFGKHLNYQEITKLLAFAFKRAKLPIDSFFRFGVVRDPVDRSISWFNYRSRTTTPRPSKMEAVATFIEQVTAQVEKLKNKPPRSYGQRQFYSDVNGELGVDYLIPLPRLAEELPRLRHALGVKKPAKAQASAKNVSPRLIALEDVPNDILALIQNAYRFDVELYNAAVSRQFGSPENAVAEKRDRSC